MNARVRTQSASPLEAHSLCGDLHYFNMSQNILPLLMMLLLGCICAAPASDGTAVSAVQPQEAEDSSDLKTDASTYNRRVLDWGSGYSGNYNPTGYGLLDNSYSGGYGGYNRGYTGGYSGYSGYGTNPGLGGYGSNSGLGYSGSSGVVGYGQGVSGLGGYGQSSIGNGGYGGYGGNGGLTSYYGYNGPYSQESHHLGYGYRRPGYGNIYSSGITPNLVTGYRGYSRR